MKIDSINIRTDNEGVTRVTMSAALEAGEAVSLPNVQTLFGQLVVTHDTTEAPIDPPATTGRKKRGAAKTEEEAPKAEEEAPKTGRKKRGAAKTEEEAPKAVVRNRRTKKADEGITDADLAKAASEAAAAVTPEIVQEIMRDDHGVENVSDIPQEERQKFLDTLVEEMKDDE
jgi:hypothetical protein